MITDNYIINNAILDFIERQPVPNLESDIYLELAPKFDDYQAPYFIYKDENNHKVFDVATELSGIKSDLKQIERVEGMQLNLSDEQIQAAAEKVLEKFKNQYEKEISMLSFNWVYEISPDLTEIKIMDDKPEEDIVWSEEVATEFLQYVEESLDEDVEEQIAALENSEEIQAALNLDRIWTDFNAASRWYLFSWKRDPQTALQEIIDAIDSYINKLATDEIALEIYDLHSEE